MRILIVWMLIGFFAGSAVVQAQDSGVRDAGVVRVPPGAERRIQVDSSSPELQRLLQRAFNLHGAFEVRTGGTVHFAFRFEPAGNNAVRLRIASGGQTLLEEAFQGRSQVEAALKAADYAVTRTTNLPGFFSGTVAYISSQSGHPEVYLADFLFTKTRRMTQDNGQALLPALSPDGRSLLYTSYHRSGFPDIYKIDLTTNQRTVFASYRGLNTGANYSPNGREVALILSGSGNSEVYVSNANGGDMRRLTRTAGLEADPSWAPSGRRLTYTSDELGKPQIFTINADGSGSRRIPTNISGNCSEPAWNPRDENLIAFTAAMGREFEVCLWNFSTQKSTVLTTGAGDAVGPVWLNDGRHLIYTERTARTSRLVVIDSLTGKKNYLTSNEMGRCLMAEFAPVSIIH